MNRALSKIASATSTRRLLARVLDAPDLAAQVQSLPPTALAKVIDHVGLEDASELVALATTQQLARVWDEDLWRSDRPGEDEQFDDARFVTWLAVMRESGDAFVAERLAELPEELVALAMAGQLLVFSSTDLQAELGPGGDDADAVEKALSSCLSEELDDYLVVSRANEGWDDVLAALLALDVAHHELVVRILERCRHATAAVVDDSGLYEVLSEAESLAADVAADREERRDELGFVAPSAAAAFLKLSRDEPSGAPTERDPITRAYFRTAHNSAPVASPVPRVGDDLARLLAAAHAEDAEPAAPRLGVSSAAGARESLLARAMRALAVHDPMAFAARSEELAYLTNVLVVGTSFEGRRPRPIEAIQIALEAVDRGLAMTIASQRGDELTRAVDVLRETGADILFRRAWRG